MEERVCLKAAFWFFDKDFVFVGLAGSSNMVRERFKLYSQW